MRIERWLPLVLGLIFGGSGLGCGAGAAKSSSPPAGRPSALGAPSEAPSPPSAVIAGPAGEAVSADTGATKARPSEQALAQPNAAPQRPGLATQFGEDLRRNASNARFDRESSNSPFVTTTIWYNDAACAEALAQHAASRQGNRAEVELMNGGLVVGVTDEWFQSLPGFIADGRAYAIGEANARYAVRILNRTDFAFEVVASVDGLNVIDGQPASLERRGYVLAPHETTTIEGFRTSQSMIAAFRFGKVSDAYSVQMGHSDRNVGVIGVAFFQEHGKRPSYPSERLGW